MSDLFTAAENIKRFAKQFEGILSVADALEQMGKLDQMKSESEKAAAKAKADADAATKARVAVEQELSAMQSAKKDEIAKQVADANANAKTVIRGAEEEAAQIIKAAQDKASSSLMGVIANRSKLETEVNAMLDQREAVKGEIKKLEFDRQMAEKAAEQAEIRLAEIQGKIRTLAGL